MKTSSTAGFKESVRQTSMVAELMKIRRSSFFLKIHLVCNHIRVNLALLGKIRVIIEKNVSKAHLGRFRF